MKNILMAIALLSASNVEAVTSSPTRSSSYSTSSSRSSTSYSASKPSVTTSLSTSKVSTSVSKVTSSTSTYTTSKIQTKPTTAVPANPFEKMANQQAAQRAYAAITPKPIPKAQVTETRTKYSSNPVFSQARSDTNAYQERQTYYRQQQPQIIVNQGQDYGMLSGLFLASMLVNVATASEFAHNHQDDDDYRHWRQQANIEAQNNAELRAKLAQIDQQEAAMSQPRDKNWLPANTPAAVVLSDAALKSAQPDFRVCVGDTNGTYFKVADQYLQQELVDLVNVVPVVTKGSVDSVTKLDAGDCDSAFVQGDVSIKQQKVFSPFFEAAHLVCHKDVKDVKSVNIVDGSGSMITWQHLAQSKQYSDVGVTNVQSNEEATVNAIQQKSCLFYVAAPHSSELNKLAERKELRLLSVKADNMNGLYKPYTLSSDDYPKEIEGGWFLSTKIQTIAVPVQFVFADGWKSVNTALANKMTLELLDQESDIRSKAVKQQ